MTENQTEALHDGVYETVQQRIINGELKPGSRIVESRLSKELRVSRTPLREALFRLEQDGFVRSEVNRGFLVQGLSAREAREIYPVLWNLEAQALDLCGGLAFTQIESLSNLNLRFKKAKDNSSKSQMTDTLWHQKLIEKCPNKFLLQLIEKLRSMVHRYEFMFMHDSTLVSESVKQHESVMAALRQRDISAAKEALIKNWRSGLSNLLLILGEP